ncbi:methyl-accepting chemotaxis protein [Heliobacterium chlorum]|uniref:Methyl-accepting chemotaxis protein n=1 Tax=Heliobacterium chlorum TaxID=2698 RepID=A0ABR7T359_HELCL|nr:methyl-accepting chemotaxis protein [Heliobacterium chlorum]MBC9785209.1 methyl-accepting chemotaxis protein [Heliobacterium chlorum]
MTFKTRLSLSFGLLILFTCILGFLSVNATRLIADQSNEFFEDRFIPVVDLTTVNHRLQKIRISALMSVREDDPNRSKYASEAAALEQEINVFMDKYRSTYFVDEEKKAIQTWDDAWGKYRDGFHRTFDLALKGDLRAAKENSSKVTADYDKAEDAIQQLKYINVRVGQELHQKNLTESKKIISASWIFSLIAAIVGIAIASFVIRSVVIPVGALINKVEEISERGGDLTQQVDVRSKDEIGQLGNGINKLITKLRTLVSDVANVAEKVSSGANELNTVTSEITCAAEQVAITISEIAKGNQQVVESVSSSVELLQNVNHMSNDTSEIIEKTTTQESRTVALVLQSGQSAVDQQREMVGQNSDTSRNVSVAIRDLVHKTEAIHTIVQTITGIASQTNLLALNAAIEAARAGEYGRGFSVVADEVRKLAEESLRSAQEITELIGDIIKSVEDVDKQVHNSEVIVEKQEKSVQQLHRVFSDINQSTDDMVLKVMNVGEKSKEVQNAVNVLNDAMRQIAAVTQETSAGSQEVASSTEELTANIEQVSTMTNTLAEMGMDLQRLMGQFKY